MKNNSIDKKEIENLLPHRKPMLLIDKLINIVDLEYPKDKLEVVIASDGSTDQTNSIIKSFNLKKVRGTKFSFPSYSTDS